MTESQPGQKELIKAYSELKELLGKLPSVEDIDIFCEYGTKYYLQTWGSWEEFYREIGEEPLISAEFIQDLLKEYFEERDLFGNEPSTEQIDEYGIYKIEDYTRVFGSWLAFLMYVDELDKARGFSSKEQASKEELVSNYYNVKQKLGHIPSALELNREGKFGTDFYTYHYGSYDKFLHLVDKKTTIRVSDEQLICNYNDIKKLLEKQPSTTDLQNHGKFSYQVYLKRFGSYNNFLRIIGEPIMRLSASITKQELFQEYSRVKDSLGKHPNISEINQNSKYHISVYQKRFGSWLNFLEEIKVYSENSNLISK